jgi:flavin reductase (DIM6/NTAB) family NADH-FMN oxidoreductase RutF
MNERIRSFVPNRDHERDLRRAFARFGTGVTVVTVQTDTGPVAMTANSFTSISLDPPLVLWAPARSSRRHDAFAEAKRFCVHVLGSDQLSTALHFAKSGDDFTAHEWHPSREGVPVLSGCLSVFHCETHAIHPAGDHSLILGEVMQVDHCASERTGLIFAEGGYGTASFFDAGQ